MYGDVQGLEDIYDQTSGPIGGGIIGGDQVMPGSQLPAQMPQHPMASPYNSAMDTLSQNPERYGNLMKSMRGDRMGSMIRQNNMPRRGGNMLGTTGQGASMGVNPWGSVGGGQY